MSDGTGAYVHQVGQAELRWMGETSTYFLATGDGTDGAYCLVEERANRGDSVPLHRHPDDMESFYVLEGELTLYIDDQPGVSAPAGSFAHIPGGTVHGFRVESENARYLILTTPRHGSSTARSHSRRGRVVCHPPSRSKAPRSSKPAGTTASSSSARCRTEQLGRLHDQDGAGSLVCDRIRHAPKHSSLHALVPDHEKIGLALGCELDQHLRSVTLRDLGVHSIPWSLSSPSKRFRISWVRAELLVAH